MPHPVKCIYCGQRFDRDKEPFVQISAARYAHKHCAEKYQIQKSQADKDYESLVEYIEKLFGVGYISAKVAKQIKDFRETYAYTYSGMLGTLVYWYEVKKAPIDKAQGGIGIIPYVYEQAKEYYGKIKAANSANADVKGYRAQIIEFSMEAPKPETRSPRLFKLEEEEE